MKGILFKIGRYILVEIIKAIMKRIRFNRVYEMEERFWWKTAKGRV